MAGFLENFRKRTPGLYWLMVLAIGGTVLGLLLDIISPGPDEKSMGFIKYLVMPAGFGAFLKQPWSFFTQVLVTPISGSTLLSFIFNLVFLYQFGRILSSFIGERKLRAMLIFAPQVITLLVLVTANLIGDPATQNQYLFGLSGLAVSVMVAVVTLAPRYPVQVPIFGQVRIMWLVLIFVALKLISRHAFESFPEMLGIVFGALVGFGHVKLVQKGNDLFTQFLDWIESFSEPKKKKSRMRVVYKREGSAKSPKGSPPPKSGPAPSETESHEETINRILDRINEVGYEKLSRQEKEILAGLSDEELGK